MIRNNNLGRNITGINKIDTTTIAISLTNKIIETDSGGQFYGITNSTGNFLKDVDGAGTYAFTQITSDDVEFNLNSNIVPVTDSTGKILTNSNVSTTKVNYLSNVTSDIQTQFNNTQPLLTAANKLDMAYVGSGNVTADELDMNIGNTTFNIYNTFLSVTGDIDNLTQNK